MPPSLGLERGLLSLSVNSFISEKALIGPALVPAKPRSQAWSYSGGSRWCYQEEGGRKARWAERTIIIVPTVPKGHMCMYVCVLGKLELGEPLKMEHAGRTTIGLGLFTVRTVIRYQSFSSTTR